MAAEWTLRQKLVLVSVVERYGFENWEYISQHLALFAQPGQPEDWCSVDRCIAEYFALVRTVKAPKKYTMNGKVVTPTPGKILVKRLAGARRKELSVLMATGRELYKWWQEELIQLRTGKIPDEELDKWSKLVEEDQLILQTNYFTDEEWSKLSAPVQEIERVEEIEVEVEVHAADTYEMEVNVEVKQEM